MEYFSFSVQILSYNNFSKSTINLKNNSLHKLALKNETKPLRLNLTNGLPTSNSVPIQRQQQPVPAAATQRKSNKKNNETSTTNLRQILNNLNIFGSSTKHATGGACSTSTGTLNHLQDSQFSHSNKNMLTASMNSHHSRCSEASLHSQRSNSSRIGSHRSRSRTRASETDTSSMKSNRRPSVDTVSTYLSHESKESLRSRNFAISVNDLLDCSLGSDEVFVPSLPTTAVATRAPAPPPPPLPHHSAASSAHVHHPVQQQAIAGSIVGVDPASDMISRFVKVVEPPQWPNAQPCPMCMEELVHNAQNPAIALSRCQHLMHLQCLNGMIIEQQKDISKVRDTSDC